MAQAKSLLRGQFKYRSAEELHWLRLRQKALRAQLVAAWDKRNRIKKQTAQKKYCAAHPEKIREWKRKNYQRLRDYHVKTLIKRHMPELNRSDIPDTLVQAWRAGVLLRRTLRQLKKYHAS
jgi:hypothetical protein